MKKLLVGIFAVLFIFVGTAFADFEAEGWINIHDITVFEVDPLTVDALDRLPAVHCELWVHFVHQYNDGFQEYFIPVKAHGRPLIHALWDAKLVESTVRVVLRYRLSPLEAWIIEAGLPGGGPK